MAAALTLAFEPTARPAWRADDAPSTSAMLAAISEARARFDALPERARMPLRALFARGEAVAFVLASNRVELVGTQGDAETLELCELALNVAAECDQRRRETRQTFLALQRARELGDEARVACEADGAPAHHVLLITPDGIREVHAVLMRDLASAAGEYRTAAAYPQGFSFFYAAPETIANRMLVWTDALNDLIVAAQEGVSIADSFKLAALTLYHAVDVHAFSDGYGRLCRILASRMLAQHHFFPVFVQPQLPTGLRRDDYSAWRSVYIGAIEACRGDALRRPADLAALLVESAWAAWQRLDELARNWVVDDRLFVGTIVLGNRTGDAARVRMRQRWGSLYHSRRLSPDGARLEM